MSRAFFATEVVQTSAMDCGPAALKSLLEGHGIHVSYGRLREACQTAVDGTSIGALDALANRLGLAAEEVMVPLDHVLEEETGALPAIAVSVLPSGVTHFVVLWRRHGPFVQVMDPGVGRRWMRAERLLQDLYVHTGNVPAAAFREFAASDEFLGSARKRLRKLGLGASDELVQAALADPGWRGLAALDAAARLGLSLRKSAGLSGAKLAAVVRASVADPASIPEAYWQVRPTEPDAEGAEQVSMRGAILVRVTGLRPPANEDEPLPAELRAALDEAPPRPALLLLRLLREAGLAAPILLLFTLAILSAGTLLEALLLRGLFDAGRELGLPLQLKAALGAVALLLDLLCALDLPMVGLTFRIARQLELRLRLAFLSKLPNLGDRYLTSRPISDMAERSHNAHQLRTLPELGQQAVRMSLELAVTAAGLCWLDPPGAPLALLAAGLAIFVPLLLQPRLLERDFRARVHAGALGRFNLDALLGLTAIRAHGAERAVRREHESLLTDWISASRSLVRAATAAESLQLLTGLFASCALLWQYLPRSGNGSGVLLFVYWAMNLGTLGQQLAGLLRQWPGQRNLALRLIEPLGALEEPQGPEDGVGRGRAVELHEATAAQVAAAGEAGPPAKPTREAVSIELKDVSVHAGGNQILDRIDLRVSAGEHVAIVGASGAGKSSLVGLLLGWHRPSHGSVLVDGRALSGRAQDELRRDTAWVDPAVQLWNRALLDNLRYGNAAAAPISIGDALADADLLRVLEGLPEGLQTALGEGGGLLSGGEGQRVRFGRSLLRDNVRLAILDEPFRGLDRPRRRELMGRALAHFTRATVLCITHDVGETQQFDRVLVVEGGRVVEDGPPAALLAREGSRYGELIAAELELHRELFESSGFRKLTLDHGAIREEG